MKEKMNFEGVDLILYNQTYNFVIRNGGSHEEAVEAGLKKVKSRYKLRNQLKREGFTY